MQLMPGTQRDLGVSEAFDPRQNVDAGVVYLRPASPTSSGTVTRHWTPPSVAWRESAQLRARDHRGRR